VILLTITLTNTNQKSLEVAQSGPVPFITAKCLILAKSFYSLVRKCISAGDWYTNNSVRMDVHQKFLGRFILFILVIKYVQNDEN
jgi:hypothetical protein